MINLINGDAIREMQNLADNSIDMVCCDPPYGTTQNKWDEVIPLDEMWTEIRRIVKPNGAICLFCDGMFMAKLMVSAEDIWRYNLIWDKKLTTGFLNANRQPLRRHEEICVFYRENPVYNPQMTFGKPNHSQGTKQGFRNNNYGEYKKLDEIKITNEKYPCSIIEIPKIHPSKCTHPTQKPVELMKWLIKTYTNPGETVLDFAMGSGTTGIACRETDRNFIGIESDTEYFDSAKKRIDNHDYQLELF